jgi:hypothetical protein
LSEHVPESNEVRTEAGRQLGEVFQREFMGQLQRLHEAADGIIRALLEDEGRERT